jgi:hypothetical protein
MFGDVRLGLLSLPMAPAFGDALSRRRHPYLDVPTKETNYFDAELGLAQAPIQ